MYKLGVTSNKQQFADKTVTSPMVHALYVES